MSVSVTEPITTTTERHQESLSKPRVEDLNFPIDTCNCQDPYCTCIMIFIVMPFLSIACFVFNKDLLKGDLSSKFTRTYHECHKLCQETHNCYHWTWTERANSPSRNSWCWMKNWNIDGIVDAKEGSGTVSGKLLWYHCHIEVSSFSWQVQNTAHFAMNLELA